jgi:2-aminoadipate transaminase
MALYRHIAEELARRIREGRYKPGERIPSIRQVAEEFECNKLTVQKAFGVLKRNRMIENVVGSGSFVRFPEKIASGGEIFDFRTSYISESFFPFETAKSIFSDLFDQERSRAFSPPPVEGDGELIDMLGEFYRLPTRRMFIVSGAQQGLDLTAKVFSTNISDAILFEDPTYTGAISLFKARHFVPIGADGPDLAAFDRKLSPAIKLFYTMPAVHNPTGISYSLKKKEALARRAERSPFYLIEDDYLSEFTEHPTPRFVDILPEKTIYIKSLSQTTVSGVRLGAMIVPESLFDKFIYTKFMSDIASTGLLQKFATRFIREGGYGVYIAETRRRIQDRKRRLMGVITAHPFLSVPHAQSGYNLWVKSERAVTLPRAPWTPGEEFSFSPAFKNFFRISFMHMDDAAFERAVVYLEDLLGRSFSVADPAGSRR